ncbi:MAG UNVERIFIED_CONTAM: penicillin-binding protein 2 [Rickettsiaceae bacterium]|jgi:cell division protein FtsI (penicillin-binding protein 3)
MSIDFRDDNNIRKTSKGSFFINIISNLMFWDHSSKSLIARLVFVTSIMTFCFTLICGKIIITALSTGSDSKHFAKLKNYRRDIVDRNDVPLAINLSGSSLFANPSKIIDPNESAEALVRLFPNLNKQKLLEDFTSTKTFVWIKRDLTEKNKEDINSLGIPGLYFEDEERRIYTYGNLFSHLIGYVGRDNDGLAGLEKSYDSFLTDPKEKGSLKLTIDQRVQAIANEEIEAAMSHFRAIAGYVIIADVRSGEIIACISKPDFNPHFPTKSTEDQLFNRFGLGTYELGSALKVLNVAIALESKKVALNDVYDITSMKVANFNVKDYHKGHGWHSVPNIFLHSSNVGMAQMMLEVGQKDYQRYLEKLGLFEKLSIEIPERGNPIYPRNEHWADITMTTMSYGYAISMTPLHFVNAVIPIVNGGLMYPLHFVKKTEPVIGTKVLEEETSHNMQKLLRLVVDKGTGRKAEVKGYLIGGKTGTAERELEDAM